MEVVLLLRSVGTPIAAQFFLRVLVWFEVFKPMIGPF